MKPTTSIPGLAPCIFLSFLVLASAAAADRFNISGFVGTSSTSPASKVSVTLYSTESEKVVDSVQTNFFGKYKFKDVPPGTYLVKVGKLSREVVVFKKDVRLDLDLSDEAGVMDYAKSAKAVESTADAPAGPNDAGLMQAMAAEYYSFSGSTERKVMLCPDGRYFNASESGYSGTFRDTGGYQTGAWGAAGQKSGGGRWVIQGTGQQGTITLTAGDGSRSQVRYQATGERGCFTFNGNTFCVSGAARCP